MTPEEAVRRGERARQIFEDPLVKEAFANMELDVITAIKQCPIKDIEGLRLLKMELNRVDNLRQQFLGWMESGSYARQQKANLKDKVFNMMR